MSSRVKIIFFGSIIALFIVGLILAFVFREREPEPVNAPVGEDVNAPVNAGLPTGGVTATTAVPQKQVTPEEVKAASVELLVKNLSKNFVERFGSYSLESNFSNFQEVADLVTPSINEWLKRYPQDLLKKLPEGFEGVSTRVVSQKIESLGSDNAALLVSTQREERIAGQISVSYKDIKVNLVLRNGEWLVDGAFWQ